MENKNNPEIQDKEIKIKYSDVLTFDPMKIPLPSGMANWDKDQKPTEEYTKMMEELGVLAHYIAMKISCGCPEVQDSIIKRCASLSIILNELLMNTAIDGWHVYGLTAELHHNVYMNMGGRAKTLELLQLIRAKTLQRQQETLSKTMGMGALV